MARPLGHYHPNGLSPHRTQSQLPCSFFIREGGREGGRGGKGLWVSHAKKTSASEPNNPCLCLQLRNGYATIRNVALRYAMLRASVCSEWQLAKPIPSSSDSLWTSGSRWGRQNCLRPEQENQSGQGTPLDKLLSLSLIIIERTVPNKQLRITRFREQPFSLYTLVLSAVFYYTLVDRPRCLILRLL